MAIRRKSLPQDTPQLGGDIADHPSNDVALIDAASKRAASSSSARPPDQEPSRVSKFMSQADSLTRMTYELNLRAVSSQSDRLERDLKDLVACTSQDKVYREQNERRLQEIWREIVAVKTHMAQVQEHQGETKTNVATMQQAVEEAVAAFNEEVEDLKSEIARTMNQLQDTMSTPDIKRELEKLRGRAAGDFGMENTTTETSSTQAKDALPQTQPLQSARSDSPSTKSPRRRIAETISSTRRWNRDYKTTQLSDAIFVANYLKQQSKRDAIMAVHIQKLLQRTVAHRVQGKSEGPSRPRSLEEFCLNVAWRDVLGTVETELVKNEAATTKMLLAAAERHCN